MAVRLLMGKRKKPRNGYRLHEYNGDGNGYQDEYSEDEDEVFVEDVTSDGLAGVSKPLMHPRHRTTRVKSRTPDCRCRSLCKPVLCFLLMVTVLGGLVSALLYALNKHKDSDQSGTGATQGESEAPPGGLHGVEEDLIGCDTVEVEDVWVASFPKLLTESAFRLVDVNQDGVLDVILGFAAGADGLYVPPVVCDIYFNGTHPCLGGLLALEGLTGRELWRHYTDHEIFALNCNVDLDGDGVLDCLGAGRSATFEAVSCKAGKLLWKFQDGKVIKRNSNLYTPQYIDDMDGDHVPDILVSHGGDPLAEPHSKTRESGRMLLMSGRTGKVLRWLDVPEKKETYYSPQIYLQVDGTRIVLFGTGGETHGGSLWVITLDHLRQGRIDMARPIYTDRLKGVMTPPVLVDLTGDGTVDIVINPYNSSVLAIDGRTFAILWNHTVPFSESYSTPGAGYFTADDTPDFLVSASYGPGYPIYYYAETTVLDGKTGKPLIHPSVRTNIGAQASPLSISMEGRGHDVFLYWLADCVGHDGEGGMFTFVNGTNVHEQSRSDFCKLRFKSKLYSKIMALSSAMKPPGRTVYYSEDRWATERRGWVNSSVDAMRFLRQHPQLDVSWAEEAENALTPQQKEQLQRLSLNKEGYLEGDLTSMGNHSPGAKKGPQLQPLRGNYPPQGPLQPQRRPLSRYQQQQPQPRRYGGYNLYPLDSYGMADTDDALYPRREGPSDEREGRGQYGYPSDLDQREEYPGYGYRLANPGYSDGYEPYKNYLQKRNLGGDSDLGGVWDEGGGGGGGEPDDGAVNLLTEALLENRKPDRREYQQNAEVRGKPTVSGDSQGVVGDRLKPDSQTASRKGASRKGASRRGDGDSGQQRHAAGVGATQASDQSRVHKQTAAESSTAKSNVSRKARRKNSDGHRKEVNGENSDLIRRTNAAAEKNKDVDSRRRKTSRKAKKSKTGRNGSSHPRFMKRRRRHVGPHDDNGLQRLLSTGTLAPSTLPSDHPDYAHTVDVIFATYWFFPAKTKAILPEDQECIDRRMAGEAERFDPKNKYYGMDHDAYGHVIKDECLEKNHRQLNDNGVYQSQSDHYDPFDLHMGQMTVYRLRVKCTCSQVSNSTTDKRCARVLPHHQQRWPAYMGARGDSYWLPGT